jgi:hypothetical protein
MYPADPDLIYRKLVDGARNCLTMDGLWFLAVEAEYGLAAAVKIDRKVWWDLS